MYGDTYRFALVTAPQPLPSKYRSLSGAPRRPPTPTTLRPASLPSTDEEEQEADDEEEEDEEDEEEGDEDDDAIDNVNLFE